MQIHARARLTILQRIELKRLYHEEDVSILELTKRFDVSNMTVQKWIHRESPLDKSSVPLHHKTAVTPEYIEAVIAYRQEFPHRGPITIAQALQEKFSYAHRGTVQRILQEQGLTRRKEKKKRERKPIPVGKHRIQMDIQTLPAVKGGKKREYKISLIHLNTRLKYSEIHPNHKSQTVLEVFKRALDYLPPFFS